MSDSTAVVVEHTSEPLIDSEVPNANTQPVTLTALRQTPNIEPLIPEQTPQVSHGVRYALTKNGSAVFSLPLGTYLISVNFTKHTQRVTVSGGTAVLVIAEPQSNQVVGTGVYELAFAGTLSVSVTSEKDAAVSGLLVTVTPVE